MRRLINKVAMIAATLMLIAVPVVASDLSGVPSRETEQLQEGKDQCLLVALNCSDQVMSIQERLDSLQREINKGSVVYSDEELKVLQRKLDEGQNQLIQINDGA